MPKYVQYLKTEESEKPKERIHPIWRGIGCLMIVIIPILSYVAASALVSGTIKTSWMIIPQELIINKLFDPLLLVKSLYAFIFACIIFFLLGMITFALNRFFVSRK